MRRLAIHIATASALFALAASLPAFPQGGGLDVRGSVVEENALLHDLQGGTLSYAGFARAEVNALNANRENAKIEADLVMTLYYGAYADAYLAPADAFGLGVIPALSTALSLDVRKLSLTLYLGPVDLTLGRTIVNWGYGQVFSPTDAFTSVDLTDISLRRTGSDVLVADMYLSDVTGLSLVASPTTDMSGFRSGLKFFTNLLGFDVSVLSSYRNTDEDLMAGSAIKGSVPPWGIGLTLEGVRHVVGWGEDGWFEAMAGLDYSFFDRALILAAEYYYNEHPLDAAALTPVELASLDRVFLREQYAFFSATVLIQEVFSIHASALLDIQDLTMIDSLDASWNVFDTATVSWTVRWLMGDINGAAPAEQGTWEYGISAAMKF
jgi:hypothetical protein